MTFITFFFIFTCIAILYAKYPTIRNTIWYSFFFAGPLILQLGLEFDLYRYDDGGIDIVIFKTIFLLPLIVIIIKSGTAILRTSKNFHNTCDADKSGKLFKEHCLKHILKAIGIFIVGIVYIFVFESLTWMFEERDEYPVFECCGESKIVDYETRTYKEKLMDTYLLHRYYRKNDLKKGELDFFFMIFWTMILAVISKSAAKEDENAREQVDIMLLIEKLAGENNLNRVAVQEIENVDPSIIENMSADSRVYFDLVLEGKIPVDDPELMKSAAAIVRGHLKTHPEDMQLVTSAFGENHPILKDLAGTEKNA